MTHTHQSSSNSRKISWLLCIVAAITAVTCSNTDALQPPLASQVGLIVAQDVPLVVQVPVGGVFSHVVLGAAGDLQVGGYTEVEGSGPTQVTNAGVLATDMEGYSILHADVLSQAHVDIASYAQVDGSVTSSQPVTLRPNATVTGSITDNAMLVHPMIFDSTAKFGASTTDVVVPPYGSASLAPGAYDGVEVKAYATLTLTAGTYTVDSLDVSTLATLAVDTQQGPVLLYVRSALTWRGTQNLIGPAGSFFLAYLGTAAVDLYKSLDATVLAPNATLHLKSASDFHGVFWAKNLKVIPHAHVVHEPFNYWGVVFPPTPTLKCVTRFTDTHYAALFGYVNDFDIEVGVPQGNLNQFNPPAPDRQPVETFLPGEHPSVFFAPFDGTSLTWILGDQSVTATAASPRCSLADYPTPTATFANSPFGASVQRPTVLAQIGPDDET